MTAVLEVQNESALDEEPVTNVNSVKLLYVLTSALKYHNQKHYINYLHKTHS